MNGFNDVPRGVIGPDAERLYPKSYDYLGCPLQNSRGEELCKDCPGISMRDIKHRGLRRLAESLPKTEGDNGGATRQNLCHRLFRAILAANNFPRHGKLPDFDGYDTLVHALHIAEKNAYDRAIRNGSVEVVSDPETVKPIHRSINLS